MSDPNAELKKLIQNLIEEDKKKNGTRSHATMGQVVFNKRGYHYIPIPKKASGQITVTIYGGGGGSGGGGSGGSSASTQFSGGGGGGGSGGGDAEYVHREVIEIQNYVNNVHQNYLVAYVGRGGEGGLGGHSVGGNVTTGQTGQSGTHGDTGRPSFLFVVPEYNFDNQQNIVNIPKNPTHMIPVSTVEAFPRGPLATHLTNTNVTNDALAAGATATRGVRLLEYAMGGYGGYGGLPGIAFEDGGTGGTGGAGVTGYFSITSGGGGAGGAYTAVSNVNGGLIAGLPNIYGNTGHVGTSGQASGSGTKQLFGGRGGYSNRYLWEEGRGGYSCDNQNDGEDFPGDVDPEDAESVSGENCDCDEQFDTHGVSLGGGGGAGAGKGRGRNGADAGCVTLEMCDCVEVVKAADGLCPPGPRSAMNPGAGAGGASGGSGSLFNAEFPQRSGAGGCGGRGANGKIIVTFTSEEEGMHVDQPVGVEYQS